MLEVIPRKSVAALDRYYRGDFEARMWDDGSGEEVIAEPFLWRRFGLEDKAWTGLAGWNPLERTRFDAAMKRLAEKFGWESQPSGRPRTVALELLFSPPKGYSAAALAGPAVDRFLLENHQMAVTTALSLLPEMLVTRRAGEGLKRIEADVFRFSHPWSRTTDPLVHEHVGLIWCLEGLEKGGALHTFPLLFYQKTLRVVYHYSLIAGLRAHGYGVRICDAGALRWDLAGPDQSAIEGFSKRARMISGYLAATETRASRGMLSRLSALVTRATLAKTGPSVSLAECRERWAREIAPQLCRAEKGDFAVPSLGFGDPKRYFLPSSITSKLRLFGRVLVDFMGDLTPPGKVWEAFSGWLHGEVGAGKLVDGPKNCLCHPEIFQLEEQILRRLKAGLGRGDRFGFEEPVPRVLASAAGRGDRIRILATKDALAPVGSNELILEELPAWDPFEVGRLVSAVGRENLIVAVRGEASAGDFLTYAAQIASSPSGKSLAKARRFELGGRPVEIRRGRIPHRISRRFRMPWDRDLSESMVFVRPDMDEVSRLFWNLRVGRDFLMAGSEERRSAPVFLERPIPWTAIGERFSWRGMIVMALKNCPGFRHLSRWTVTKMHPDGSLCLKRGERGRRVTPSFLRARQEALVVLEPYRHKVVEGDQLEVLTRYWTRQVRFDTGEIVLAHALLDKDAIALKDGRVVPPNFRALAPCMFLPAVPKYGKAPDIVVVQEEATEGLLDRLREIRFGKRLIVLTDSVSEVRGVLGGELHLELDFRRKKLIEEILEGKLMQGLFPPRAFWREKLAAGISVEPEIPQENSEGNIPLPNPDVQEAEEQKGFDEESTTGGAFAVQAASADSERYVELEFATDGSLRRKPPIEEEDEQPKVSRSLPSDQGTPMLAPIGDFLPPGKKKPCKKPVSGDLESSENSESADPNEQVISAFPESKFVEVTIDVEPIAPPPIGQGKPAENSVPGGAGSTGEDSGTPKRKVRKSTPSGDDAGDIK